MLRALRAVRAIFLSEHAGEILDGDATQLQIPVLVGQFAAQRAEKFDSLRAKERVKSRRPVVLEGAEPSDEGRRIQGTLVGREPGDRSPQIVVGRQRPWRSAWSADRRARSSQDLDFDRGHDAYASTRVAP